MNALLASGSAEHPTGLQTRYDESIGDQLAPDDENHFLVQHIGNLFLLVKLDGSKLVYTSVQREAVKEGQEMETQRDWKGWRPTNQSGQTLAWTFGPMTSLIAAPVWGQGRVENCSQESALH